MSVTILAATEFLAARDPQGPEFGKASPLGLLIVVVLLVVTGLLVWSMNKQLRKLPKTFDRRHPGPDQEADDGTDRDGIDGPDDGGGSGNHIDKGPTRSGSG